MSDCVEIQLINALNLRKSVKADMDNSQAVTLNNKYKMKI